MSALASCRLESMRRTHRGTSKAGCAGEAEFRLKNVSHRGLKPATPDARIDEEIDIGRRHATALERRVDPLAFQS